MIDGHVEPRALASVVRGKCNPNLAEPCTSDIGILSTNIHMTVIVRKIVLSGDVRAGHESIYSGRPLF